MSTYRLNEETYCLIALATANAPVTHACKFTRGNRLTNCCPNDGACRDRLGLPSVAADLILKFRLTLWRGTNSSGLPWTVTDRRNELKRQMSIERHDLHGATIRHHIGGIEVCKDFFRAATGFERKMFNQVYVEALGGVDNNREVREMSFVPVAQEREEEVCSFLDTYFKGEVAVVETDPAGVSELFLKKRWSQLYSSDYLPACTLLDIKPVPYSMFCAVRKRLRPHYRRSPKVKEKGWSHVRCQTCEGLEAKIKAEKNPDVKSEIKTDYRAHLAKAGGHRKHYKDTRHKAVRPSRMYSDMSMILDAAGGLGSTYAPHYIVSGKGEPDRHLLHKFKSTFSKIHGLGTSIFLTHSSLETEGSNLNLECIYKSIATFMERRRVSDIRNLYIQLDNTNSNKSWTLLAGCAALIALGIVRKVKVFE